MSEIGRLFKNFGDNDRLIDKITAAQRITESLEDPTEENLTSVLGALRRLLGFDAATVYLINSKGRKLHPAATLLNPVELPSGIVTDPSDPEAWESLPESPVSLSTVSGHAFASAEGLAHVLTAPMKIQERLNGLLNLAFVSDEPPPDDAVRLAGLLGSQLAWAVERCQYRSKLTALYETLSQLDTTQRLKTESAQRVQNLAEAHDMLVNISHEVNNSLSVIIGNVQCLIMEKVVAGEQSQDRLHRIESAAVRISTVNKKLLKVPALTDERSGNLDDVKVES